MRQNVYYYVLMCENVYLDRVKLLYRLGVNFYDHTFNLGVCCFCLNRME